MESLTKRKRVLKYNFSDSDSDNNDDKEEIEEEYEPPAKKTRVAKTGNKLTEKTSKEKIKKEPKVKIKKEPKEKIKKEPKEKIKKEPKEKIKKEPKEKIKKEPKSSKKPMKIEIEKEVTIKGEDPSSSSILSDAELSNAASKAITEAKKHTMLWKDDSAVAEICDIPIPVAKNVMMLLDHEYTVPFIARYRREMTGDLPAEKLRDISIVYEEIKQVHKKVENVLKTIKHEKFDESVATLFLCAKTLDEVELLYAPFKAGSTRSLAERSKQLGLDPFAQQLMQSKTNIQNLNLHSVVSNHKGLENVSTIMIGIQHIIADSISKHPKVLEFLRMKSRDPYIRITSSKSQSADKLEREGKNTQNFKYENYFNVNYLVKNAASHQIMALNRGEKQKVLSVKIQIPIGLKNNIAEFIWKEFFGAKSYDNETYNFLQSCVNDAYERLIEPFLCRRIRSELTKKAQKDSIGVFGSNVKSLLLTPPVRGKSVLGIDPGFSHGCKIAAVSSQGEVSRTAVIYPHSKGNCYNRMADAEQLKSIVVDSGVEIFAIGNGTACRETEVWISDLIKSKFFSPYDVKYCIVNEDGASIYSVTKEAEIDLPGMDPNIRSAVSIARRLQDPLLEYVKIEPKHLGVGMYQHDVPETQLQKTLDSIVEECVSFVGVDLNVCPEVLLRKISGLSSARAKQIIDWRTKNGCFVNRQQLLEVKGLGQKSYEQCAGFVKILPQTCTHSVAVPGEQSKKKRKNGIMVCNPLDRTIIHPESYPIAEEFLKELKISVENVGEQVLVDKINNFMKFTNAEDIANRYKVAVPVIQLIVDSFRQLQDYDIRKEFEQPLFRTSVRSLSDVSRNQDLSGRVTNITGFGAFVDIGIESNGLIHISKMKGQSLSIGDRVTVKVLDIDINRKRIGLELL